ncbi:MAG: hypothetical protein HKM04_09405 [Legionellales bacterium]|nr:hypothetical protein [Legionellales bacterium]
MLKQVITPLILITCLGASVGALASSAVPASKAPQNLSAPEQTVVYKRKQESNPYPLAASSYENNFLKSMMGVGMQTPATRQTTGRG